MIAPALGLALVLAGAAPGDHLQPGAGTPRPASAPARQAVEGPAGPEGWQPLDGGPQTGCGLGTPYSFFYRPGTEPGDLLVYFQGGGACWSWVSCSGMFDTQVEAHELADDSGIFDARRPDNPLRGHAILFIPYCTGDIHVGAAEVRYGDDETAPPVRHRGAANVEAALSWIRQRHPEPRQVVIAGASAGAYGAVFHAPRIARMFPGADKVVVADSGVPLLHGYEAILQRWGAGAVLRQAWGAGTGEGLTLERAYRAAATAPKVRAVAVLTSDQDAVQAAFYLISGSPDCRRAAYGLLEALQASIPSLRSFVVAGADHGLLRTDAVYGYTAGGTSLVEWLGSLVAGRPVESVRCDACRLD